MRAHSARARSLLLLLWLAFAARANAGWSNELVVRGLLDPPDTGTGTATGSGTGSGTLSPTSTSTSTTSSTTSSTSTSTSTSSSTSTSTTSTSTSTTSTSTLPPTTSTSSTSTDPPVTTPPPQVSEQLSTSTGLDGSQVTVTSFVTNSAADATASSATPSSTETAKDDGGIKTSTIIGLSVAGGVALLGVVGFVIWKFTRKRYSDFDDEPIKWPELNMHGENLNYALPANRAANASPGAGGAGAGLDSASEVNLSRNASGAAYSQSQYSQPSAADSTADLYAPGNDPYAVPPLPHVNPNQPYRDDPTTYGAGYYDPYRGPVPHTFNDAASVDSHGHGAYGTESIPMSNLAVGAGAAGRRSPGPGVVYDPSAYVAPQTGRQSPGPNMAYGGRQSPGPGVAYGGRQSPGPNAAYGGGF